MPSHLMLSLPRTGRRLLALAALIAPTLIVPGPRANAATFPPGFTDELLPPTFVAPTNLRFLPDGRLLVTEKRGRLYLWDGSTSTLLWSREDLVLNSYDRGLIGLEVDPTFPTGRWVYLLYSCDPDSNADESNAFNWGRLERYQMATGDGSLLPGTRQVLFGTTWADGPLCASGSHSIGGLAWGRDGTLLVTAGDGAHYSITPDPGGLDAGLFIPGRCDPAEDIGAFRSRMLQSLNGKVLRLDPATGHGLPSNPFWDGDPTSRESRVYATGLRNPFRFTIKPGTGSTDPSVGDPGTIYYGDVGWSTWEEFGAIRAPGLNMGWPCYESAHSEPQYQASTPAHDGCVVGETTELPFVSLHHSDPSLSSVPGIISTCAVGGVIYQGPSYPAGYYGGYFVGAYAEGWIKVIKTNDQDQFVTMLEFGTGADGPVAFDRNPINGDVYFVSINTGRVHRIRYTSAVSVAPATPAPRFALRAPWPNPSPGATRFALDLPEEAEVSFEVLDAQGRQVWSAPRSRFSAGPAALSWPGTDREGRPCANGLYFARALAGNEMATRKFVVVR